MSYFTKPNVTKVEDKWGQLRRKPDIPDVQVQQDDASQLVFLCLQESQRSNEVLAEKLRAAE